MLSFVVEVDGNIKNTWYRSCQGGPAEVISKPGAVRNYFKIVKRCDESDMFLCRMGTHEWIRNTALTTDQCATQV